MRIPALLAGVLFATTVFAAAPLPYDEQADAKAAVSQALVEAKAAHVPVLLIFGANWCEDCRVLDSTLKQGRNAELIKREFRVVKVDVGNFDHNTDLTAAYGNPTKKGIPAAVVLSPNNEILYATKAGELSNARRMSESGIYDFFKQASVTANTKQ